MLRTPFFLATFSSELRASVFFQRTEKRARTTRTHASFKSSTENLVGGSSCLNQLLFLQLRYLAKGFGIKPDPTAMTWPHQEPKPYEQNTIKTMGKLDQKSKKNNQTKLNRNKNQTQQNQAKSKKTKPQAKPKATQSTRNASPHSSHPEVLCLLRGGAIASSSAPACSGGRGRVGVQVLFFLRFAILFGFCQQGSWYI